MRDQHEIEIDIFLQKQKLQKEHFPDTYKFLINMIFLYFELALAVSKEEIQKKEKSNDST